MALELKRETVSKIVEKGATASSNEINVMDILKGANEIVGSVKGTIREANDLFKGYNDLKQSLTPAQSKPSVIQSDRRNYEVVAPALPPTTPTPAPVVEPAVEDKKAKAEAIFKRAQESLKPFIPNMGSVTALQVFQMCMQPENKAKIIEAIAKEL